MWEKLKNEAALKIVSLIIVGIFSFLTFKYQSINNSAEQIKELKTTVNTQMEGLSKRIDTEIKFITLKDDIQNEKISDLEKRSIGYVTKEELASLYQQQKEATDRIEKKLDVVYEKLIYKQ